MFRTDPQLRRKLFQTLETLEANPYDLSLKADKLQGRLEGLHACWIEYNCRLIYFLDWNEKTQEEYVVLIDVCSHDEVYGRLPRWGCGIADTR
jgi:mRNA-degrading endonuclease YafQ of YafQ-DinJ toxin-antitoxin module